MPADLSAPAVRREPMPDLNRPTGCVALADGSLFWGHGFGAEGTAVGELCFNTAMTGYQEIMTDPSYAHQIVTFTFPHIGNTGTTPEDDETAEPVARGMVVRWSVTDPSSWRSAVHLSPWLAARGRVGVSGIDTRRLTRRIRAEGMPHAVIAHAPEGTFDIDALVARARTFAGLEGADLAAEVSPAQSSRWAETGWRWGAGFGRLEAPRKHVVAIDFGAKADDLPLPCGRWKPGDGPARVCDRGRSVRSVARRSVLVQRARRSRGNRCLCRASYPGSARRKPANLRNMPRTPAFGPRAWSEDRENGSWPPRCEPPGEGDCDGSGSHHVDEPRVCGRCDDAAEGGCGDPRLPL